MTWVRRAVRGSAAAGALALAWGVGVERSLYVLRHATAPLLEPGTRPLRILQVSDLHLLPYQTRRGGPLARFLEQCARSGPDVVVASGDLLGDGRVIGDAVDLLRRLRGDRPGLFVLGSNDSYGPVFKNPLSYLLLPPGPRRFGAQLDTAALTDGLRAAGWTGMDNRRLTVPTSSGDLDVAGLGDPHIDRDRPERLDWSPPPDRPALRLGLVHAPYLRALDVFDRHGYHLVLAGHTHGGQVRLPGYGALSTNCDLPRRQSRGLSRHGADLWLHVSAGLGHARYAPYRFACRPEATVLDLVPRARPQAAIAQGGPA